jgi:hypothetical protein
MKNVIFILLLANLSIFAATGPSDDLTRTVTYLHLIPSRNWHCRWNFYLIDRRYRLAKLSLQNPGPSLDLWKLTGLKTGECIPGKESHMLSLPWETWDSVHQVQSKRGPGSKKRRNMDQIAPKLDLVRLRSVEVKIVSSWIFLRLMRFKENCRWLLGMICDILFKRIPDSHSKSQIFWIETLKN